MNGKRGSALAGLVIGFAATSALLVLWPSARMALWRLLPGTLEPADAVTSLRELFGQLGPGFVLLAGIVATVAGYFLRQSFWVAAGMALPYPVLAALVFIRAGRIEVPTSIQLAIIHNSPSQLPTDFELLIYVAPAFVAALVFARIGRQYREHRDRRNPASPSPVPIAPEPAEPAGSRPRILGQIALGMLALPLCGAVAFYGWWQATPTPLVSGLALAACCSAAWQIVRQRRVTFTALRGLGAMLVLAIGVLVVEGIEARRHYRQMERIDHWAFEANKHPPAGVDPGLWNSVCIGAIHNALHNYLLRPRYVPTEKVRQLADYLDATQASDLNTLAGALGFIEYLEEICPAAKDYSGFGQLRWQLENEFGLKVKPVPPAIAKK